MAKIHAALTPLNIDDPKKDTLVLKFDSPLSARNVRVQLVEMDANEGGTDDLVAIFEGEIVNPRKFQGRLIREGETAANAPSFKFQFEHDATVYEFKIPSGRGEHEQGAYEIGVKVDGTVGGAISNFVSSAPAFIRGLPQANQMAQHRPRVTFIARKEGKGFYGAAKLFWEPVSDGIRYQLSLEQIIAFLNNNSTQKTKDGLEYGQWGEINIVSHANEEGQTTLRLFKKKSLIVSPQSLKDNENDPRLEVTPGNMDNKTSIIWRGCNVGKSQEFLDKMRALFGGQCRVYGPKYIQMYDSAWSLTKESGKKKKKIKVTHAWEFFVENFYFDLPWPYPKKPKIPPPEACAAKLESKYPAKATTDEWRTLIKDKKSRHDSQKPMR
ncbi:MAG: hypothetical protein OEW45_18035, partial [Deltaproteobacteria bacterium]|nr:hypothetical protein [Deltaproteobacteria bacterium]